MVVAQNLYEADKFYIRYFIDQNMAADFIEQLVIEE
jgi:hypothetical protein